jgi:hypothetical protein
MFIQRALEIGLKKGKFREKRPNARIGDLDAFYI